MLALRFGMGLKRLDFKSTTRLRTEEGECEQSLWAEAANWDWVPYSLWSDEWRIPDYLRMKMETLKEEKRWDLDFD